MSGCVIAAFRNGGKHQLSNLEPLGFELLFFDQGEGVHGNLLQRLKPRCLLEIELRHSNVANVLIIYMILRGGCVAQITSVAIGSPFDPRDSPYVTVRVFTQPLRSDRAYKQGTTRGRHQPSGRTTRLRRGTSSLRPFPRIVGDGVMAPVSKTLWFLAVNAPVDSCIQLNTLARTRLFNGMA